MGGAQIQNIADPVNNQDAMTMNSAMNTAAGLPRVWVSGVHKSSVWEYYASATVSTGTAVFYITDDGTSGGNAVFANIYTASINLLIHDSNDLYNYSSVTVAGNKKSITVTVNQIALSLGVIVFTAAANGTTVYLQVKGD